MAIEDYRRLAGTGASAHSIINQLQQAPAPTPPPSNTAHQNIDMGNVAPVASGVRSGGRHKSRGGPPDDSRAGVGNPYERFNNRGRPVASQANLTANQMDTWAQRNAGRSAHNNPYQNQPGYDSGGPMVRTMEFRDSNGNGVDDRDEPGSPSYMPGYGNNPYQNRPGYDSGGPMVRTMEFQDSNGNGVDDRDEPGSPSYMPGYGNNPYYAPGTGVTGRGMGLRNPYYNYPPYPGDGTRVGVPGNPWNSWFGGGDGGPRGPGFWDRLSGRIAENDNWLTWGGRLIPGAAGLGLGAIPWVNRAFNPEARNSFVGPPSWLDTPDNGTTMYDPFTRQDVNLPLMQDQRDMLNESPTGFIDNDRRPPPGITPNRYGSIAGWRGPAAEMMSAGRNQLAGVEQQATDWHNRMRARSGQMQY